MRAALIAPLLLALATPVLAEGSRTITVMGSAEARTAPDRAAVSVGVDTRAKTAAEALASNAQTMTAVFTALDAAGIDRTAIQTSQFGLSPVFEPYREGSDQPPAVVGYDATNGVTVTVTALDKLGTVIDALAVAGANRFDGVSFDVADPRAALDVAREKAVADAQARAALYARAAGVTLGPVLSISEQSGVSSPLPMRAEMVKAAPTPIAPGTVTLSTEVQVVYGIE